MRNYLSSEKYFRSSIVIILLTGFASLMAQMQVSESDLYPCQSAGDIPVHYQSYVQDNATDEEVSIWYDYGREYYKIASNTSLNGNYQEAIVNYWKVILNDRTGRFKVTFSKLADSYLALQQPDSALIVVYMGLAKYPDYQSLHYTAGKIFKALDKPECAAPHYEALVQLSADDPKTQLNYLTILAKLYFQMEDERCVATQRKVVELDPRDVEAATLLVRMMDYFGHDTMDVMRNAFMKDTRNLANARAYGQAAFEAGQYQESLKAFNAVIKQEPKDLNAMKYIAKSYEDMDKLKQAADVYEDMLKIDKKNLNALVSLASVKSRTREFAAARRYVRTAISTDPNYGWSYMVMGEIYENAVSHCSSKRDKGGYTYDDKLVYELARAEYRKAAARDPNVQNAADKRVRELAPFVRTEEDRFMYTRENITDACYKWIEQ